MFRLKEKLLNALGSFGIVLYYLINLLIAVLPILMIHQPFWLDLIILLLATLFPLGTIALWIWGLVCAIIGEQDIFAIFYYVVTVIIFCPFLVSVLADIPRLLNKFKKHPKKPKQGTKQPERDIFIVNYYQIIASMENYESKETLKLELIPAMFILADMAALLLHADRASVRKNIIDAAVEINPAITKEWFYHRIHLYETVLEGKHIRGEWVADSSTNKEGVNPIAKCIFILGDILYNPECTQDYDNAPFLIGSIFDNADFASRIMTPLGDMLTSYVNKLAEVL